MLKCWKNCKLIDWFTGSAYPLLNLLGWCDSCDSCRSLIIEFLLGQACQQPFWLFVVVNSSIIDCLRQLLSLFIFSSKFLKDRILKGQLSFDWKYWHISCLPVVSWLPEDGVTHTHHHTTEGPRVWQQNKQIKMFTIVFFIKKTSKSIQIMYS